METVPCRALIKVSEASTYKIAEQVRLFIYLFIQNNNNNNKIVFIIP